jgi:hypothetical protein
MPRTPTEKPRVEKRVQDLQKQWATPVPRVQGLIELNLHLHRQCLESRQRACGDNVLSVGERFEQDRAAALPLPSTSHRFDPCIVQPGQVDKYQTVRFDRNCYSVPRRWAFRPVSVKGYVDRVEVVGDGATIATHLRCYQRGQKILDPLHFLAVLEQKPGALNHAPVYRDWQLPRVFLTLKRSLEERHGSCVGTRHYIRVLQLLTNYPIEHVENAIANSLASGNLDAAIIAATAHQQSIRNKTAFNDNALSLVLSTVTVRPPDLSHFDRLLSHYPKEGDADECRDHTLVVEGQPEATTLADDVGRMGEVGA